MAIDRNIIDIGNGGYILPPIASGYGRGINITDATGFIVEENEIFTTVSVNGFNGTIVHNSGADNNEIYKNKWENLPIGSYSSGLNRSSGGATGLYYTCNTYTDNEQAIKSENSSSSGIREEQGVRPLGLKRGQSSGNIFNNNTTDIINNANSIYYMHNGGSTMPVNVMGSATTTLLNASSRTCASRFPRVGVEPGLMSFFIDSLSNSVSANDSVYQILKYNYYTLLDGGNTASLKSKISNDWSSDAWLLRNNLMAKSPYLSEEVLLEAASQSILPSAMLLEILLANPDATKNTDFSERLLEASNNTFPGYMLNYVENNENSVTTRTNLENDMTALKTEIDRAIHFLKYFQKSKEEYTLEERYETVLLDNKLYSKTDLLDYFIENKQFDRADSLWQKMENDKEYQFMLPLLGNMGDYITFRSNLGNRNLAQLDSLEIGYLETLAENEGRAAGYAQNILCFFYDICYEKEFSFENTETKSAMANTPKPSLNSILYNFDVYPNPASEYATIEWEFYDELQNASYKVFDLSGNEIMNSEIITNQGVKVIDTRNFKNGVYIIGFYNNNQIKANKKLVIDKGK